MFTLKAIVRSLVAFSEFNLTSGDDLEFLNGQLQRIEGLEHSISEMFSRRTEDGKDYQSTNIGEIIPQQDKSATEKIENPDIQNEQPTIVQNPPPERRRSCCCCCFKYLFGLLISLCLACVVTIVCLGGNLRYDMNPGDVITSQFWKSSCENTGSIIKSKICEV